MSQTTAPVDLSDLPRLLTVRAVAELLSCHDRTVRRWLAEKLLHFVRVGSGVRIPREAVARFLAEGAQ